MAKRDKSRRRRQKTDLFFNRARDDLTALVHARLEIDTVAVMAIADTAKFNIVRQQKRVVNPVLVQRTAF